MTATGISRVEIEWESVKGGGGRRDSGQEEREEDEDKEDRENVKRRGSV